MRRRRQRSAVGAPPDRDGHLPSIWVASYAGERAWAEAVADRDRFAAVADVIDDRMLVSRHPSMLTAWCVACEQVTPMHLSWHHGAFEADGSVHPSWPQTAACQRCGLNSRMRAVVQLLRARAAVGGPCFVAERITPSFAVFERMFRPVVGSEFLGAEVAPGSERDVDGVTVRHEDLTRLTFPDRSFETVVTQDVFEHVPDYRGAFRECHRVLRAGGRLVFTVPFFPNAARTLVRAVVRDDGEVEHLLPPEIHGNPLGGGSLCFQHFGWDLLDELRAAGFAEALAHAYWGPWQGHLGFPFFVFEATKRGERAARRFSAVRADPPLP